MSGELLTIEELAEFFGVCKRTAERIVSKPTKSNKITIEIVKLTKRTVRYIVKVSDS